MEITVGSRNKASQGKNVQATGERRRQGEHSFARTPQICMSLPHWPISIEEYFLVLCVSTHL